MITVKVEYEAAGRDAGELRVILCGAQASTDLKANPLLSTKFNETLGRVAQEAFDEGRRYQRENPDKKEPTR